MTPVLLLASTRADLVPATVMDVLPYPPQHRESQPARKIAGLDAVRAGAVLGVVLLHSSVPYLEHPMPGLVWPIRDNPSSIVDVVFWTIELFIMPLFLLLAGFFAWQTLYRRGVGALVKSRSSRLLKPLLFGSVFVLPFDLYCWVAGWVAEGWVPVVKLKSLSFDPGVDQDLWGLSHLWFLQYLYLYVLGLAAFAWLKQRIPWTQRVHLGLPAGIVGAIILGSVVLFFHPEVVWGFQHDFLPVASKWLYSGLFFALGAFLAAFDEQLTWLASMSNRLIAPAAMCAVAALVMGQWYLESASQPEVSDQSLARVALAVMTCTSAALAVLSMVGVAAAKVHHVPDAVGYLAAASFWIYLVHHPLVGLVQIDLQWLFPAMDSLAKMILAFVVTSTVCLLTYESFVRCTSLGRWLGFDWQPPRAGLETPPSLSLEELRPARQRPADSDTGRRAA